MGMTMDDADLAQAFDRQAIARVIADWAIFRDCRDWDRLRALYAPGATMVTTWLRGTADEFVDISMAPAKQGGNVQHVIGPPSIALNGNRAIAIARVTIMVRGVVHGTQVDVACTGRFHDWLARGADGWKIVQRMPIYEKDRMDPVEPGATVNLDKTMLERIAPGYRYLGYLQTLGGTAVITDLPAPGSAEERKLYDDSAAWLAGG